MQAVVLIVGAVLIAAGCGSSSTSSSSQDSKSADKATITLYNGQHESTTKLLVEAFTKSTGIKVKVRSGDDPALAHQILQENAASPADVFYTENSPALALLSKEGKLAELPTDTLDQVPAQYRSTNDDWIGVAGRETVLVYNPSKLDAKDLPKSLLDIGGSSWDGKVGIGPSGADFQAIIMGVIETVGADKTDTWLRKLKKVAEIYSHNSDILQAVNRGDISAGIIYHYYYFRDQAESGANSENVKMYYFGNQDPGAFISVSGAGVLTSSKHKTEAQQLVQFLSGVDGQRVLAQSDDFEYPLNPEVPPHAQLKPFASLQAPEDGVKHVGDGTEAVSMLRDAGLL